MTTKKKAGQGKRRARCAELCRCWHCTAQVLGQWLDALGRQTPFGAWLLFLTITYRTVINPWRRGSPVAGSHRPSAEFAHHLFGSFVQHLESEVHSPIAFVVADQYGEIGGRLHQHALISGKGLDKYPRRKVGQWLRTNAGFNRVLPFRKGAAYYVARYIGRNLDTADWNVDLGRTSAVQLEQRKVGGVVTASSADLPSNFFHQTMRTHGGRST